MKNVCFENKKAHFNKHVMFLQNVNKGIQKKNLIKEQKK